MKKYIVLSVSVIALSVASPVFAGQTRVISDQEIAVEMVKRTVAANPNISSKEQNLLFDAFQKQISTMTPEQKIEVYAKAKASSEINSMSRYADDNAAAAALAEAEMRKADREAANKTAAEKAAREEETRKKLQDALTNPDGTPKQEEKAPTVVPEKDLKPLTDGNLPGAGVVSDAEPVYDPQNQIPQTSANQQYIPRRPVSEPESDYGEYVSGAVKRKVENRENLRNEYQEYLKNQK